MDAVEQTTKGLIESIEELPGFADLDVVDPAVRVCMKLHQVLRIVQEAPGPVIDVINDPADAEYHRRPNVGGRAAAHNRYVSSMMKDALARLEALPDVLTLRELARVLRCSESTIKRRLRAGVFPIPTLRGLDKRVRFAKAAVARYLDAGGRARTPRT